jgi:hypothetical protein
MSRVLLLAVVVLSLLGVAGCGSGDTKTANAYVESVNKAQTGFADTFTRIQAQITPTSSVKEDRATLADFETAIDDVVGQLRGVKPPDKVKALHAQLIAAIASYRDEVEKARRAFASHDRKTFVRTQRSFVEAVKRISVRIGTTITTINKKLHE